MFTKPKQHHNHQRYTKRNLNTKAPKTVQYLIQMLWAELILVSAHRWFSHKPGCHYFPPCPQLLSQLPLGRYQIILLAMCVCVNNMARVGREWNLQLEDHTKYSTTSKKKCNHEMNLTPCDNYSAFGNPHDVFSSSATVHRL